MLKSFVFEFNALPMKQNPQVDEFIAARVHVYVFCHTMEEAESKARDHIAGQRWDVGDLVLSLSLDPKILGTFDKPEAELHQKAISQGVASKFFLRPKQERRAVPRPEFRLPAAPPNQ